MSTTRGTGEKKDGTGQLTTGVSRVSLSVNRRVTFHESRFTRLM
jgi:hypothetical protein